MVEVTPPQFNHVFFTNSGSEANDTNLRLVHRYYDLLGKPEKELIISRKNAYHGSTIAAASLGGMSGMHKQTNGLDYVHHINQPHWFEEGGDESSGGIRHSRGPGTGSQNRRAGRRQGRRFYRRAGAGRRRRHQSLRIPTGRKSSASVTSGTFC